MESRIDHKLDHKANLNKFKKIEIISSIFPTTMNETRNQKHEKTSNTWRLNNVFLNNYWDIEEIKGDIFQNT